MSDTHNPEGLKYFTNYVCPTPGCGRSSHYTGGPNPGLEARIARGEIPAGATECAACGAPFVEEGADGRSWRVSFEARSPYTGQWRPLKRVTNSQSDAESQYQGLLELAEKGEVRHPKLQVATIEWVEP